MEAKVCKLIYPGHLFAPEEFLTFVECDGFGTDWNDLGLGDIQFYLLQVAIMVDPTHGKLIRGAGGLREGLYRPDEWTAERILKVRYVMHRKHGVAMLVAAFEEDVPAPNSEECREIKNFIARERRILARRAMQFRRTH